MALSNHGRRTVAKIIKYTAIFCIIAIVVFLFIRMNMLKVPESMTELTVNDTLAAAYEKAQGEGTELQMFRQELQEFTMGKDNRGYFAVPYAVFIPEAKQLQIVFRYNNSTLKYVAKDLGLDSVPNRDDDVFDVTVFITSDRTPENKEDNYFSNLTEHKDSVASERIIKPSRVIKEKHNIYNYRKYVFDGVEMSDLTLGVFIDVYYCGNDANGNKVTPDYNTVPMGAVCIYRYDVSKKTVALTDKETKALTDPK